MRKSVGFLCSLALVLPGVGGASLAQDTPPERAPGDGYCRKPAALPNLAPEVSNQQSSNEVERRARSAGFAGSVDAPMLSPPPPPPAPPPPPPTSPVSAAESGAPITESADAITVTASRRVESEFESATPVSVVSADKAGDSAEGLSKSMPVPPRPGPPQPRPQSGLLTAGEHDDLLNPELYADYVRKSGVGQQVRDLPRVDTSRMLTVEVRDDKGRASPFASVELRCSDGNSIKLKTVADGKVVFFPEHDRLSQDVWVRARGSQWRKLSLSDDAGSQSVTITSKAPTRAVTKLDLALVVDVTGSMSDELRYLQAELGSIVGDLKGRHSDLDIRVGLTFYRDQGDAFVTRTFAMGSDIDKAQKHLDAQRASGGGDYEEAMQDALIRAANQEWRDDAVKTLLLVADAPPHNADIPRTWLAAEHLRRNRVHIVPVGASGVADTAEYVMRAMAAVTQSRYTFLTEDSGIGNPKAPPAIDCYLVTRLDQLLRRVIDSQISGRRVEPDKSEVIRTVGQYDAGRCVLPPDFGKQA
ncbi:MAG: vWA domain-containing protein [Pseudomonadota bacterium]